MIHAHLLVVDTYLMWRRGPSGTSSHGSESGYVSLRISIRIRFTPRVVQSLEFTGEML